MLKANSNLNTMCKTDEIEALEKLNKLAIELQKIESNSSKGVNIFNAIGMVTQEIRHSHFLAWLFNSSEKHDIDNLFLQKFLEKLICREKSKDDTYSIMSNEEIIDTIFPSRNDYINLACGKENSVITEKASKDNNGRTDIVIKLQDTQTVIVIENKVFSSLHDEQLSKYEGEFSKKDYSNWKKVFVYLTPTGEIPVEQGVYFDKWCVCSYNDIIDILEEILKDKALKITNKLKYILEDYIEMVKTNILMDNKKIRDACKDIYAKHKDALEILYSYTDNTKEIMEFCKEYLNGKGFVNIIAKSNSNTQFYFLSDAMFKRFGEAKLSNPNSVKFSYRITKEHDYFEKLVFFKKDSNAAWEQWQKDFLKEIATSAKFGKGSENSQKREIIVDSDTLHGVFDDVAKEELKTRLDIFISEIREYEKNIANIIV